MNKRTAYVKIMHTDPNIGPQHPSKAIKNIAEPITINTIGITLTLISMNASRISSYAKKPTPSANRTKPHNTKIKLKRIRVNSTIVIQRLILSMGFFSMFDLNDFNYTAIWLIRRMEEFYI